MCATLWLGGDIWGHLCFSTRPINPLYMYRCVLFRVCFIRLRGTKSDGRNAMFDYFFR